MSHILWIYSRKNRQISFYIFWRRLHFRNIFVSKSRRSERVGYSTQTAAREGYPVIRSLNVTLPREPRFNFYGAPIAHPHVATLPRGPEPLRPQWNSAPPPLPSPFRIKSEKSRGASRQHCVTCRCGSVCGRQRRYDANSGRLCLCHWIIHLHVYRGMKGDKCKGKKSATMKITGANGEKQWVRDNAEDRVGGCLIWKNRN